MWWNNQLQIEIDLGSFLFISRHDFPNRYLGEEPPVEMKLLCLRLAWVKYFLPKELWRLLPLFHDKLLPGVVEASSSEPDNPSSAPLLDFEVECSSSLTGSLFSFDSQRTSSWSELEPNASKKSMIPSLSKIARTSAAAFSAVFLWIETNSSRSSSSTTYNIQHIEWYYSRKEKVCPHNFPKLQRS